jgi:hypothetical protein
MIKVECYFSHDGKRVATVQYFGNHLRMSRWAHDGPLGHADLKPENLERELKAMGFQLTPSDRAAATLEFWALTSEFELGTRQALYLAYWNTFGFYNRPDLCRQLDQAGSLQKAIELGAKLLRQELPDVKLF